MVFQDPLTSLDPRMTVYETISEPLTIRGLFRDRNKKLDYVLSLMDKVGLADYHSYRYPHELSKGQCQRVSLARAIASKLKLLIADEPVSSIDVSIKSQIINLLMDLQKELEMSMLVITHDLSVVKCLCDTIVVMYLGKIVEIATTDELFDSPLHPYTQALLSAIPIPDPTAKKKRIILRGDVPSPVNPPPGCRFHTRCAYSTYKCKITEPELVKIKGDRWVACHRFQ